MFRSSRDKGSKPLMLLPELSPADSSLDCRSAEGSQEKLLGGPVSGEREEHRQHVSSGILRKQSWIRGLDTPAPGENLVPN